MDAAVVCTLLGVFALLIVIGAPVALALGGSAALVLVAFFPLKDVASLATTMAGACDSLVLLAIPFFVLAGTLLAESRLSQYLVDLAAALTRRLPGGLGVAMVVSGIFLAGISGSGPADVAILGTVMMPLLLRDGYRPGFASGLTAVSGSIGIIVPPSIALIIFGSVAPGGVSIERLFLGGVVPGLLLGFLLCVGVVWICRRHRSGAEERVVPVRFRVAVWRAKWALLFPAIILGGIYLGFFTPTESAAVAVIYAVFVSGVVYRELSLRRLVYCLGEAARITAGVMILVASAAIFARVLNMEQAPQAAARLLEQRVAAPWILLLGTNLLLLAMGCVLDAISVFYILVPILLPPLVAAGFDPVHLGVVFTVNLAIGQVTPPVGVSLFVSCELSRTSIGETLRQSWLLLVLAVISLVLLNLFPALVLWLPSTMRAAGQ